MLAERAGARLRTSAGASSSTVDPSAALAEVGGVAMASAVHLLGSPSKMLLRRLGLLRMRSRDRREDASASSSSSSRMAASKLSSDSAASSSSS
eukprot:scaffold3961_cov222-Pinguiococcus_pyrenoidosus.AAC.1